MKQVITALVLLGCFFIQVGADSFQNYKLYPLGEQTSTATGNNRIEIQKSKLNFIILNFENFSSNIESSLKHRFYWPIVLNVTKIVNEAVGTIERMHEKKNSSCIEKGRKQIDSGYYICLSEITLCIASQMTDIKQNLINPFLKYAGTVREQLNFKCPTSPEKKHKTCMDSFAIDAEKFVRTLADEAHNITMEYFFHLPLVETQIHLCDQNALETLQESILIGFSTSNMC